MFAGRTSARSLLFVTTQQSSLGRCPNTQSTLTADRTVRIALSLSQSNPATVWACRVRGTLCLEAAVVMGSH